MSNALSIAAATLTLRNLLNEVATADYSALPADARPVNTIDITTLPPDQVRPDATRNRVNLFLYHTEYSAAWRNTDPPRRGRPGEALPPLLPLNLHYLLTVYGENDNELIGQVLLGAAMRILHDHPVLGREEIATALAQAELDQQVELVRVTPLPLSPEDVSGIWSGFQSVFRLSAGYEVGVVLIDSSRAGRAALPVLRRGAADTGPAVMAGAAPTLSAVAGFFTGDASATAAKPSAELGDTVELNGSHFGGADMTVRLTHALSDVEHTRQLLPERDDTSVRFTLPSITDTNVARDWPAGFYGVELVVTRPDAPSWTTNRLSFALAPSVSALAPPAQTVGGQPFALTITATPQILADQRVRVLLGDREIAPDPGDIVTPTDPDAPSTVTVTVDGLTDGSHVARLRIDGIDSLPVDFTAVPPTFDPAQTLVVAP